MHSKLREEEKEETDTALRCCASFTAILYTVKCIFTVGFYNSLHTSDITHRSLFPKPQKFISIPEHTNCYFVV